MSQPQTFVYSTIGELEINLDIYLPPPTPSPEVPLIPIVIFFHGGGIFRGNRKSILPEFKDDVLSKGWGFISADYRLLLPSTGHDILQDIKALFTYISTTLPNLIPTHQPDPNRILVSGHSGGAYVARQAAIHGTPKPKAFFSLSGQGGELLMPYYFTPKQHLQKKLLGLYKKYSTPDSEGFKSLKPCSDFYWSWPSSSKSADASLPGTRSFLSGLASHMGTRLDYLTGKPGFCESLLLADGEVELEKLVPDDLRCLFPELKITEGFPPSFVVHGMGDKSVMPRESEKTARDLVGCGVECVLVLVENWGHGYNAGVYERWIRDVIPFFERQIQ